MFFKNNWVRRSFLAGLLSTALVACNDISISTSGGTSEDGPKVNPNGITKIALLVPSGAGDANLESLASSLISAAELAIADNPEANVELRVYSTAGNAEQAASVANKAISQGAKLIVGPLFADASNAVGRIAAARNINVLSFSNNPEVAGGNVMVLGNSFKNTAERLVSLASSNGFRNVAVVTSKNAAGDVAISAVRSASSRSGARFSGSYTYPFSPDGITQSMPSITNSVLNSGADAVVLNADSATGLPLIAQRLKSAGFGTEEKKILGLARWDIPTSTLGSAGLRGGWFAIPDSASITSFNGRFQQRFGSAPHPLAGVGYDAVKMVAQLLEEKNTGAVQRGQLTRSNGFKGASGIFRILKNGTTQRALSVAEVTPSGFKVISAAPKSFSGAGS